MSQYCGVVSAGNERVNKSSNINVSNDGLPEHPFVACVIDGVPVNALLHTGSIKSFISDRIHNIFDFDGGRLDTLQSRTVVPQLPERT